NNIRREIIFALEAMGMIVEYSHHEVAPSQHEIDLRYAEAMKMADTAMTYRVVVKEIARKHGSYATFMPKPIFGENGSGMHVHQSLFKNGKNVFYDANDQYHLSAEGKSYIAGILKHAPEFVCVTNQWVNSYKRLVPGYEAPVYIAWARRNRSALVRVPMYKPGKEVATRMELRCPDPAANPYLAFAVQLAAGMKGMEEGYELAAPVEEDIFEMNDRQLKRNKIKALPGSLYEAAMNLKKSKFMKEVLGEHLHTALVDNKIAEWDEFRTQVTEFELDKYLPIM
ncbi:MAG: glutamine synthetase, partial [Proteobacteria bacterium]|nr:glutamine synthetase [Pseudomonadota bacterium]